MSKLDEHFVIEAHIFVGCLGMKTETPLFESVVSALLNHRK